MVELEIDQRLSSSDGRVGGKYLLAGAEVFTLGLDTLVVVDIVLPAVLGPRSADVRGDAIHILGGSRTGSAGGNGRRNL